MNLMQHTYCDNRDNELHYRDMRYFARRTALDDIENCNIKRVIGLAYW